MKSICLSIAISATAATASAQANDVLQLAPSLALPSSVTSACLPSRTPSLCVPLAEKSAVEFANWSKNHVGKRIDIKVNGQVASSPRLLSPMSGGHLPISFGSQPEAEAADQELHSDAVVPTVSVHD